jgi:hypothetical protein
MGNFFMNLDLPNQIEKYFHRINMQEEDLQPNASQKESCETQTVNMEIREESDKNVLAPLAITHFSSDLMTLKLGKFSANFVML